MKTVKRTISLLLVVVLLLSVLPSTAFAATVVASGYCGGEGDGINLTWELTNDGTLTISGTGTMASYDSRFDVPWYKQRNSIYNVVIENGIRNVGGYTFYGCPNLRSVIMPNSVISIGNHAFCSCSNLTSANIPNSVTTIGGWAFRSCKNLDTTIPYGVTSIGMDAFAYCGLKSLVIPNSVTTIGGWAFSGCNSLTSVYLPDSLTSVGQQVFSGCSKLSTVTIPNTVKTLYWGAFSGCSSLTSVFIPDSVVDIRYGALDGCKEAYFAGNAPSAEGVTSSIPPSFHPTATLYYIPGTTGWTDSADYDVATGTWRGYKLKMWDPDLNGVRISAGKYAVMVQDSQGTPLDGVSVIWNEETAVTPEDGVVYFDKNTFGEPLITATKDGYIPYTNEGTNYQKSDKGYDIITLYTEAEGKYRLSTAKYIWNDIPWDVLTGTKRLSLSNSSSTFGLQCKTAGGTAEGYKIIQGNRTIAQSSDGQFENLLVGNFFEKEQVYVAVITPDGDEVRTPINLQFVKDESSQGDTLKLGGDKLEFTVGEDVPFVGGGRFTFDIPPLPLDFYRSDDTVHLGINIEFPDGDKDKCEEKIKDVKRLLNTARYMNGVETASGHSIGNTLQGELNFLMKDKNNKAKWGPADVDWNFIGYGEGKLDENGLAEINAYLCLTGSVSTTIQGPTVVVVIVVIPVPVSYNVNVSAKGELACEFTYDLGTGTTNGDLALAVTPELEAFGGFAFGDAVGAGAYGSASLPFEIQLMGSTISPGLNYVDLTGELGLAAYAGNCRGELPFAYNTWHLYTRTGYNKQAPMMLMSVPVAIDLTDESLYHLSDLSYLEDQSEWLGYGGGISLFSVTSDTTTDNELAPLQIGTYRNMQPVIGAAGETPVMVWVTANTDRGDYNYPQLVYSVYENGVWQEPMPVDDNDTLDSAHTLYTAADGTLWLAYQDTAEGYNTADLSDFAACQTIRVARFDETTGAFTDFVTVSEPGVFSRNPVITEQDGVNTVMWVANTDNSYFGENNTNTLYYAQYENGTWGEMQVLASGLNAITETVVGNHNGVLSAAVITDGDNDLSTTDDRTLWLYDSLGQAQQIATGSISAVTFAKLPGVQASDLLWSDGNSLVAHDTGTVFENSALSGGFMVLSDRVVYSGADGEDNSNLFAQIYDNGTWTAPVHVTVQEQYLQSYAVAEIGEQTYLAAAQAVVDITESSVDETCTLSWAVLSGRTDAAITAVDVDYSAEAPGAEVPVYVDVANLGDTTISEYTVIIGTEVSETITTALAPGEETTVELVLSLGETVTTTDYTVAVIAENDGDDTNDISTVTIGHSDLSVYTEFLQAGENRTMLVKVANEGAVSADGTLSVTSEAGEPKTVTVDTLEPGEFSLYRVGVTSDLLGGAQAGLLTATVTPNATEWNELNDRSTSYVEVYKQTATEVLTTVEKTSMVLGNDLSIMFAFTADDIAGTDNYATITKSYADGTADRVERIEQSAWGNPIVIGGKNYYAISFDGVAAKEMTDEVQVQIFNVAGEPISEVFTDSIRDYAMRMIENGTSVQMFVDMLVYGAEAQKQFGYGDILATSALTAKQLAQATQSVSYENKLVADDGYRASSLILESNIRLAVLFGGIDQTMTAEVSFTDHYGDIKSYTVSGSDFEPVTYKGEDCYSITVDKLVVADGRQPVSITVKDADGNVVASATDSVESYIARMSSTGTLYEAIMKFSDSAAAGLKN